MDKEFIVRFINNNKKNHTLHFEDIKELFIGYCCEEHNKSVDKTMQFIKASIALGVIDNYLQEIIEYYKLKYNITELRDKNNNLILTF